MSEQDNKLTRIEQLAELLHKQQLTEIHYKDEHMEVTLHKSSLPDLSKLQTSQVCIASQATCAQTYDNLVEVKSELIGTIYKAPGPDQTAFVKVEDTVEKGDVMFIIECMKTMNKIKAPCSGIVKEILIRNEELVDYNKTLAVIQKT